MREKDYNEKYLYVKKNIITFRRRRLFSSLILYLLLTLSILSAFIVIILFIDNIFYLREGCRSIIRVVFLLIPLIFIYFFAKNTRGLWRFRSVVGFMEKRFPLFKGRLFTATECSPIDPLFSQELIYANLRDVKNVIRSLPPTAIITDRHKRFFRFFYSIVIFILLLFALSPHRFFPSFTRVVFNRDILSPIFFVYPGDGYVEKGANLNVSLKNIIGRVSKPSIIIKNKKILLKRVNGNLYKASIENIETNFTYHIEFSDTFSNNYTVDVIEHPRIGNITFTLHYPSYTNEKDYKTSDFDIYALKGTKIRISGRSTQPLKKASLQFTDSTRIDFSTEGSLFTGEFYVDTTRAFTINLLSKKGFRNLEKPLFHIFSYKDEYPSIEIVKPGEDIDLPQELAVDIVANVSDDYGISKILLLWEKGKEKHTIPIASNLKERSSTCEYRWNLMDLPMFPGDTLRYYAVVFDNDIISGPKAKRTKTYSIRFPTAEEIYREVTSGGEKAQESFKTESSKLEELKKGFQELEKSLRETKNLSWEEKKKAEEIIKQEKELIENIEKTRKEMQDLTKRLNDAFLSNPEIKERLKEIERLMKEVETEKIRKSIEKLNEALAKMSRKEMLKSMEKMVLSSEEIKKSLERTIEILKSIEQEARFERIAKKAEELKEKQKKINEEMRGKKSGELKDLETREKGLEDELGNLKKEMEDLAKELGQNDSIAKNALENGSKMAMDLLPQLKNTRESMKQGKKNMSLSLGNKAEQSLSKMSSVLSAGLSSMLVRRRKEIEKRMNAIIEDIILLSKKTEQIMNELKENESHEDAILSLEDGVREGVKKTLANLEELKTKNPLIPLFVDNELLKAVKSIELSANNIMRHNQPTAFRYAKASMRSLNNAALELIESMENLPSGGGGSMAQLLQQLQSLSSGQMQVNRRTQALLPLNLSSGNIPMEAQRELQRLSELQGSLSERLRRVEEGLGKEEGDVLGDLGRIANEMEEIAKELGNYHVDRKLVEREERILSRMLDAQRSVHKREFSKKRVAERPGKYVKREPPPLPSNLGEKEGIKKDILKELKEKYPQEYRDLIRAYFDRLLKEEKNK